MLKFTRMMNSLVFRNVIHVDTNTNSSLFRFWLRRYKYLLVLKQLSQLPILMHGYNNITSTDKFLLDIELWYGWPFRVLLDTYIQRQQINA